LAVLVAGAFGCEALVGIKDRTASTPDAADDTAPPPPGDDAADAGGCMHDVPPPRPTAEDGNADLEFYVALQSISIGVHDDGGVETIGLDLDGLCTCPDPAPCAPFAPTDMHCDGPGGIDNAMTGMLGQLARVSGGQFDIDGYDRALRKGLYNVVLRVSHYNGGANDTSVTVALFQSNGTMPSDWPDASPDAGAPPVVVPAWDGNDVWTLDDGSLLSRLDGPIASARYFDTAAYVSSSTLVAHIDFPLRMVGDAMYVDPVTVSLEDGALIATVAPQGSTYRLDNGLFVGRWPVRDMSNALAEIHDQIQGGYLCAGGFTYGEVKALVCKAADIPENPAQTDPRIQCDALSAAARWTAYPAKMGQRTARPPSPSPCADAAPTETCK
jgi:hypothetical protein